MTTTIVEYANEFIRDKGHWCEQWTEGEEHVCWHDTKPFTWMPVPIVTEYDDTKRRYRVYGCFCSWSCAKTYMIEHSQYDTTVSRAWLSTMAKEIFGYQNTIKPAEQWCILSVAMDIETFGAKRTCVMKLSSTASSCMHGVRYWKLECGIVSHLRPEITRRSTKDPREKKERTERVRALSG